MQANTTTMPLLDLGLDKSTKAAPGGSTQDMNGSDITSSDQAQYYDFQHILAAHKLDNSDSDGVDEETSFQPVNLLGSVLSKPQEHLDENHEFVSVLGGATGINAEQLETAIGMRLPEGLLRHQRAEVREHTAATFFNSLNRFYTLQNTPASTVADLEVSALDSVVSGDSWGDVSLGKDKALSDVIQLDFKGQHFESMRQGSDQWLQQLVSESDKPQGSSQLGSNITGTLLNQIQPTMLSTSSLSQEMLGAQSAEALAKMPLTMSRPDWQAAFEERVSFMLREHLQSATIRVDPPELGPIRVEISRSVEATQLTFYVNHPTTRELLESQVDRLKATLANDQQQVEVDVRQDNEGRGGDQQYASSDQEQREGEVESARSLMGARTNGMEKEAGFATEIKWQRVTPVNGVDVHA